MTKELKKRGVTPPISGNYYTRSLGTTFLEETIKKLKKNKNASARTKKRKRSGQLKKWHSKAKKKRQKLKEVELIINSKYVKHKHCNILAHTRPKRKSLNAG